MKDKINKLINLYKDDPYSIEGKSAYSKALELIDKYGFEKREFGIDYGLAIREDYAIAPYKRLTKTIEVTKAISTVAKNGARITGMVLYGTYKLAEIVVGTIIECVEGSRVEENNTKVEPITHQRIPETNKPKYTIVTKTITNIYENY